MKSRITVSLLLLLALILPLSATTMWDMGFAFKLLPYNKLEITDTFDKALGYNYLLQFQTPKNDGMTDQSLKQSFRVSYSLDTPGTLYVFFSSKPDLGGMEEGKGKLNNPYMMILASDDATGLNYSVERKPVTNGSTGAADAVYSHGPDPTVGISGIQHDGSGSLPSLSIKSGVCLSRTIGAGGAAGIDQFELSLDIPKEVTLDSGLYTGYVIVQFTSST